MNTQWLTGMLVQFKRQISLVTDLSLAHFAVGKYVCIKASTNLHACQRYVFHTRSILYGGSLQIQLKVFLLLNLGYLPTSQ